MSPRARRTTAETVIVDSSAFLALEDPSERRHTHVLRALTDLHRAGSRVITTNFVFDEAYTLVMVRLGRPRAFAWGQALLASRSVQILDVGPDDHAAAWWIIAKYTDQDFSFTDATTFAVSSSLGIRTALSLDAHFSAFGMTLLPN